MTNPQDLAALVAQATPGPWAVEGARHSGDLKIGPNTRLHFVGPDGDAVAAVFFDMKTGQGLPDAKLIAMAPDLARTVLEQQDTLEAQATEIARLTAERDRFEEALGRACLVGGTAYLVERAEKAEAERDAALAQVAGAYEAAAKIIRPTVGLRYHLNLHAVRHHYVTTILALTPASALAARDRRDAQMRAEGRKEGLREAAEDYHAKMHEGSLALKFEGYREFADRVIQASELVREAILAKIKEAENG